MSKRTRVAIIASAILAAGAVVVPVTIANASLGEGERDGAQDVIGLKVRYSCSVRWQDNSSHVPGYYAGYSDTWTTVTRAGQTNARVVEVQCLLDYSGINPGPIDGIFGTQTRNGVVTAQKWCFPKSKDEWDGIVGPNTWKCLRNAAT